MFTVHSFTRFSCVLLTFNLMFVYNASFTRVNCVLLTFNLMFVYNASFTRVNCVLLTFNLTSVFLSTVIFFLVSGKLVY